MAQKTAGSGPKQAAAKADVGAAVVERRVVRLTVPVINFTLEVPRELIPYYAGLGAMAALELVDWPLALLMAAGHTLAAGTRNQTLRELGKGVEDGG